ncbi:MAG: ABC transporter permease subunit [Actinomycetota bacterium]|nr:ABC transporter permease subunit [Actinomycetota bacterium]
MTLTTTDPNSARARHARPPLWRNTAVLKWFVQIVVLLAVLAVFWFFAAQARNNLSAKGIPVSYDWLDDPANIQLGEGIQTVDEPDGRRLTMSRALWVGMVNTLRIASIGIIAATAIGVVVGIARLSNNWLARKVSSIYVETLRNIPVLVQIILWLAILGSLGKLTVDSGPIPGWVIVSQKGISIPRVFFADGFYQFLSMLAVLSLPIWWVRRRMRRIQEEQGGTQRIGSVTFALSLVAVVIAWFANPVMAFLGPVFDGISDAWAVIPQGLMQAVLSIVAVLAAVTWIRRFLDSRRTPAGLAKLIDDDWFRMIFAGVAALLAVFVVVRGWPGLSSWIINSGSDLFGVIGDKFGDGRGSRPLDAMKPTLSEGRFVNYGPTGLTMTVFYASLFFGLVFYTSSFIAEIVRGGIQAVPVGQSEAAAALGLNRRQALRKVVLPQAFRVIMPPLGNQYLNITKNTSLGIAVGFSEIVQVGQTVYNKNSQTLAVFSIYMIFFLACSLTISFVVNTINRRLAIVER